MPVARTCIVDGRTTIACDIAAPDVMCTAGAVCRTIRISTYAASPFSSAYARSGMMTNSAYAHEPSFTSGSSLHCSVTSVNLIILLLFDHVLNARAIASWSSWHVMNLRPGFSEA